MTDNQDISGEIELSTEEMEDVIAPGWALGN